MMKNIFCASTFPYLQCNSESNPCSLLSALLLVLRRLKLVGIEFGFCHGSLLMSFFLLFLLQMTTYFFLNFDIKRVAKLP